MPLLSRSLVDLSIVNDLDMKGRGGKEAQLLALLPWGSHPSTCPVRVLRDWLDLAGITSGPEEVIGTLELTGIASDAAGNVSQDTVFLDVIDCEELLSSGDIGIIPSPECDLADVNWSGCLKEAAEGAMALASGDCKERTPEEAPTEPAEVMGWF
jgi:hypothetical protein